MERAIDHQVMQIQKSPEMANAFIRDNDAFIRSCVHHWHSRSGTPHHFKNSADGDDHHSIALEAFHEAIQTYNFERGSFYSFSAMVIERRLIDHARKETRHLKEVPIDPYVFESGSTDNGSASGSDVNHKDQALRSQVLRELSVEPDDALKLEIEAANQRFSDYGFSFFDLADCSPKAQKTKSACALAVNSILESPVLLQNLQENGQLPIKSLEKMSGVPRKILERHRKYIIAAVEIVGGDYPHLSQYMRFIRKETSR